MKAKILFGAALLVACAFSMSVNAQSWVSGTNKLYVSPDSTKVGIGVVNPQYKLDLKGKMYMRTVDREASGLAHSYLQWEAHKLIMGVPAGKHAYTMIDLIPGGSSEGDLYSQICLYHAYDETNQVKKIRIATKFNNWINTDYNFGLGTDAPQYKLDVRGTIRAEEILVTSTNGADFVFNESYPLRPLIEVNDYIQKHHHLPEIPSAVEMQENGVNMNELQIQLLQKIEELTLYIIQQEQRIQTLESQLAK